MNYSKWDRRFLELARHISGWSKDRSTKVGAVIVNDDKRIVSVGYNGFPVGVDDDVEERHTTDKKYQFSSHAEENAIHSATRLGVSLIGCHIYCTHRPCSSCARAIIQTGIRRVVYGSDTFGSGKDYDNEATLQMFNETGVELWKEPI